MIISQEARPKILRIRKKLEEKLKVKILIHPVDIEFEGDQLDIYIAQKVIEAIERNFPINVAFLLIEENYIMEDINIKELSKKDIEVIRGRIIGQDGSTLRVLSELSECYIQLNDNFVSIIGPSEKLKDALNAIKSLIQGSKQANIYAYLEKAKRRDLPSDLGLKETFIKKLNKKQAQKQKDDEELDEEL